MKTKAHTVYKNKAGKRVPGVTTILGVMNKPALVYWSWDLGMQGIDYRKFKDDKAEIGTLAHELIRADLRGETLSVDDWSKNQIDQAEVCFKKYLEWKKRHVIEPILVEQYLVSEQYQYGGSIDLYCLIDGVAELVDHKTSKAIYGENGLQLAGYWHLLKENGYEVSATRILRIGRDAEEGFEEKNYPKMERYFDAFKHCLDLYNIKKELKL